MDSTWLEAGLAHYLAPFVGFGGDELAEVSRRAWGRLTAKLDEPLSLPKSNPYVLMVQSAKDRPHFDAPSALNDSSNRRILA
jgi:hypothetical protein